MASLRPLGHSDQGGRPDGVQVMAAGGYVYVGHMLSNGITTIDARDPRAPVATDFIACPPNTRAHHIQVHDGLLLAVNAPAVWAAPAAMKGDYFAQSLTATLAGRERDFTPGIRVFALDDPAHPREIGFLPVDGLGPHRIWWAGGRYAYASVHFEGFTDHILAVIDLADPTRPRFAGQWWLPGMHAAGGETPQAPAGQRWALHHMIPDGRGRGFAAWRDGGLTVMDLTDPVAPQPIAHRRWAPPYAGGTHTPLPLPGRDLCVVADEATAARCAKGLAYTWVFDIRDPANPVSVATLPQPAEEAFCTKGGKFGPHNLHENRPGSLVSETLIFATYQNAGLRVFDITDAYAPRETARYIPPPPARMVDTRPDAEAVIQASDVFVTADGLVFLTDNNAGLSVLAFEP